MKRFNILCNAAKRTQIKATVALRERLCTDVIRFNAVTGLMLLQITLD